MTRELERVARARHRRAIPLAVATIIAAQTVSLAVGFAWLVERRAAGATAALHVVPVPIHVAMPLPPAAPAAEPAAAPAPPAEPAAAPDPIAPPAAVVALPGMRPACPPPNRDAPSAAAIHAHQKAPPLDLGRVVTAHTNAGWIAGWNDDRVEVSVDGGRTFERVLDGPGKVRGVSFDCFGALIVVRDDKVGMRVGTKEAWRAVPGITADPETPLAIIGGGPDVVIVAIAQGSDSWQARLAVSSDYGHSWWFKDLVHYWETTTAGGHQKADGTIHMTITQADCMSDPVSWLRIKDGVVESDELGTVGQVELYEDYAINASWHGVRWKRFGEADWRTVTGLPDAAHAGGAGYPTLFTGPLPRLSFEGVVYKIERGRATRLRTHEHRVGAVDRAGRLWTVDDNESDTAQLLVE